MPLNDDVENQLSDAEYWALVSEDAQPCSSAVPEDVLAEALSRLDDFEDHLNGEQ